MQMSMQMSMQMRLRRPDWLFSPTKRPRNSFGFGLLVVCRRYSKIMQMRGIWRQIQILVLSYANFRRISGNCGAARFLYFS